MAIFQALSPTDHVIAPLDVFYGTSGLLQDLFARWGLETSFVDMTDPRKVRCAIQSNTKLIWIETPSNPLLKITDIAEIAALAHEAGARCVCDNTFATPVLQSPFRFGADLIAHASAKYLGGHCDAGGGLVIVSELLDWIGPRSGWEVFHGLDVALLALSLVAAALSGLALAGQRLPISPGHGIVVCGGIVTTVVLLFLDTRGARVGAVLGLLGALSMVVGGLLLSAGAAAPASIAAPAHPGPDAPPPGWYPDPRREARPRTSLPRQLVELGLAHADERVLGGDEETVGQH